MGAKVRFLYWFAKQLCLHTMTQFNFFGNDKIYCGMQLVNF